MAYDKNKQYTRILLTCDKYGWPVYMPTDEVEVFDTVIETGRYWVDTPDGFALHGNGWYCDSVVEKALQYGIIKLKDIKYQIKASHSLDSNHFEKILQMFIIIFMTAVKRRLTGLLVC